jgi:large subunit ribosomal protein L10
MPKTRQQKEVAVESLTNNLKQAKGAVFANFQGLTVAATENLRNLCHQEKVKMLVVKKTLVKRAFSQTGLETIDPEAFKGGVATFTSMTDEVTPAKLVSDFAKKNEAVVVFGGLLEGKFIDQMMVKNLSSLPGKQELLSKLVGSLNAPLSGFVNVLAGNLRGLVSVLNNIKQAKA